MIDTEKRMWNMKVTKDFDDLLKKVSQITDRPASQFVREAVREKIDRLAQENPKVAEVVEAAA